MTYLAHITSEVGTVFDARCVNGCMKAEVRRNRRTSTAKRRRTSLEMEINRNRRHQEKRRRLSLQLWKDRNRRTDRRSHRPHQKVATNYIAVSWLLTSGIAKLITLTVLRALIYTIYTCVLPVHPFGYTSASFYPVGDLCSQQPPAVWSSPFKLSTVGSRAFPVAAAQVWNDLPEAVVSSTSLQSFRRQLKTHLFQLAYLYLVF